MSKYIIISTKELQRKKETGSKIIDVRSVDAYNGWKERNESRGGHIKGAKSLPVKWTKYMDWIETVRHKEIFPEDDLVLYGYTAEESEQVAAHFIKAGYQNISLYQDFLKEWVPDENLEMEILPRYRHLVSAEWVKKLISGDTPAEYDNDKYVIVHSHYRNRDAYLTGHIPRAIDMDTNELESPETWNRRSPSELKKLWKNMVLLQIPRWSSMENLCSPIMMTSSREVRQEI